MTWTEAKSNPMHLLVNLIKLKRSQGNKTFIHFKVWIVHKKWRSWVDFLLEPNGAVLILQIIKSNTNVHTKRKTIWLWINIIHRNDQQTPHTFLHAYNYVQSRLNCSPARWLTNQSNHKECTISIEQFEQKRENPSKYRAETFWFRAPRSDHGSYCHKCVIVVCTHCLAVWPPLLIAGVDWSNERRRDK